jgi:hypothetical protein
MNAPELFFFNFTGWGETDYCTSATIDGWVWSIWWNENWQRKPKYSEETCPSTTLTTTNLTWLDLVSNTGRVGWKPSVSRPAQTVALYVRFLSCFISVRDICFVPRVLWSELDDPLTLRSASASCPASSVLMYVSAHGPSPYVSRAL